MAIAGKRVVVVMPAYNAARTLEATLRAIPEGLADHVLLVDDASNDETVEVAHRLGLETIVHHRNRGYGANQKTCYAAALRYAPDVVAMLHPDYQYSPRLLRAMCSMIVDAGYDLVLGSRILCGGALEGGMPLYKYVANRALTFVENLCLGSKLSEFHTGYRVYARRVLEEVDWRRFSDDFVFDNEFLAEAILRGFRIGEVSCPARYFAEASSIRFGPACRYGMGVLRVSLAGLIRRLTGRAVRPRPFNDLDQSPTGAKSAKTENSGNGESRKRSPETEQ